MAEEAPWRRADGSGDGPPPTAPPGPYADEPDFEDYESGSGLPSYDDVVNSPPVAVVQPFVQSNSATAGQFTAGLGAGTGTATSNQSTSVRQEDIQNNKRQQFPSHQNSSLEKELTKEQDNCCYKMFACCFAALN